jgi:hypothetical protein
LGNQAVGENSGSGSDLQEFCGTLPLLRHATNRFGKESAAGPNRAGGRKCGEKLAKKQKLTTHSFHSQNHWPGALLARNLFYLNPKESRSIRKLPTP